MVPRSLGQQSLPGWLWLLATVGSLGQQPGEDHDALLSSCPFPVALVDLPERRFLLISPSLVEMLGQRPASPAESVNPSVMVDRPGDLGPLCDLMMSGAMDFHGVARTLARPGRQPLEVETWMVVSDAERRARALWLVMPAGEEDTAESLPATALTWPERADGLVLGSFDLDWRIARISSDVQAVLGYPVDELIGTHVIDLVHPDDVPALFSSVAAAMGSQSGVSTRRRLRHRSGEWVEMRGVITPLPDDRLHLGFAFSAAVSDREQSTSSTAGRAAALERHMWQIASEVAAAGVVAGFHPTPVPEDVPGLSDLSSRQWEVLTRLLQGERVPSIARQMFISQSTVRNHLTDIFRKVGVRSQEELLRLLRPSDGPTGA